MIFHKCTTGIYSIYNKITEKRYIGQSVDISKRIRCHLNDLRTGKHQNQYLQRAWNVYGENAFDISIIEECKRDELDDKEIFYIREFDAYNHGYNLTTGGHGHRGFIPSEETRERISNAVKANPHRMIGKDNHKSRSVVLINTGEVFDTIREASEKYKVNKSNIGACCYGGRAYAGVIDGKKMVWLYFDEYCNMSDGEILERIEGAEKARTRGNHPMARKVVLENTGEIFDCIKDAAEKYNIGASGISICCAGKMNTSGYANGERLRWRYLSENTHA